MITCFKSLTSDLEQAQYSLPKEDIVIDENILRVISRIGVILNNFNINRDKKKLLESIPLGRESFLLLNTEKHSKGVCKIVDPNCELCSMNNHCDYYNSKNMWISGGKA